MSTKLETFPSDNPVNLQALLSTLSPEKFAEVISIETFDWTPEMFRRAMSQLGPKQRAFCDCITRSSNQKLDDVRRKLKLQSIDEAEQVIADLRRQLIAMEINPQEVYAADLVVRDGKLTTEYYSTGTFLDVWERVNMQKAWKARNKRRG